MAWKSLRFANTNTLFKEGRQIGWTKVDKLKELVHFHFLVEVSLLKLITKEFCNTFYRLSIKCILKWCVREVVFSVLHILIQC